MSTETAVVESAPNHTPPSKDDSITGRYASVMFSTASRSASLHKIFEDMKALSDLYQASEALRAMTENSGLSQEETQEFIKVITSVVPLQPLTIKLIELLSTNKRLLYIDEIAGKYKKLYVELNREEKITIISADQLNSNQQAEVLSALKENPNNVGKHFILEFKVDKSIKGGLILFTESEFMDMSLTSRVNRIRQEVNSL
eukprot:CAMPEP_0168322862 /NCGR_PEP_ID=MMETSP0213-20121227/3143_1 /TAXON_ID=151035 /ORGANISM="Euplotes harpa, Strain FSP1.4" /LENGTH=200 /DNA_ID=CAMNT_0008324833 /DNA_START=72 /DNA_END=674 /DNA_ORIENTATION=+